MCIPCGIFWTSPEKEFDPTKVLSRRNFSIDISSNIVYLYVGFSKTNRDLVLPIPGNSDPALDPVRHLAELFSRVHAQPLSPAFSYASGRAITFSIFSSRLKTLLTIAGFQWSLIQEGGASYLHACGATAPMVQAAGDWSSNCFTRYIFLSVEERLRSQMFMSRAISAS